MRPSPTDPRLGVTVEYGVENGINQNVNPTFLFDSHTHHRPVLHRLHRWPQNTTRQTTYRAIGTGRLCYSIGGLKHRETSLVRNVFQLNKSTAEDAELVATDAVGRTAKGSASKSDSSNLWTLF